MTRSEREIIHLAAYIIGTVYLEVYVVASWLSVPSLTNARLVVTAPLA